MPANTLEADVNEIMLGYYLLGGTWSGFKGATDAKQQLTLRIKQITEDKLQQQNGRAIIMASDTLKWARKHGFKGSVKFIWWTARPGVLARAVGVDVDSRKNPTDVLIQFTTEDFLGVSAKSTKTKGDIGFKNPGIGPVEKGLGIKLVKIPNKASEAAIKKYDLSATASKRKIEIRQNPKIQEQTIKLGQEVLSEIRNEMFKALNRIPPSKRSNYILESWMDAGKGMYPPYIKVTGMGAKPPFTSKVENPKSNDKLTALITSRISFEKVGSDAVGVKAGNKKLLKMRAKYESEKLASTVKFSGEPW